MNCCVGDVVTLKTYIHPSKWQLYTVVERPVNHVPGWYALQLNEWMKHNAKTPEEKGWFSEVNRLKVVLLLQEDNVLLRSPLGYERLVLPSQVARRVVASGERSWLSCYVWVRCRGGACIQQLSDYTLALLIRSIHAYRRVKTWLKTFRTNHVT